MADGSMRLRAPWPPNEIEILCRLYNRHDIAPLLDALPRRSPKAIHNMALVLGLREPVTQVKPINDDRFERELTPREQIRTILGMAGAPMTPVAVADRMPIDRWQVASLLSDMAEDGEIVTVTVADRHGLITLSADYVPPPVTLPPPPKPRYKSRKAEGLTKAEIINQLKTEPLLPQALAERVGVAESAIRMALYELKQSGKVRVHSRVMPAGTKRWRYTYTLNQEAA